MSISSNPENLLDTETWESFGGILPLLGSPFDLLRAFFVFKFECTGLGDSGMADVVCVGISFTTLSDSGITSEGDFWFLGKVKSVYVVMEYTDTFDVDFTMVAYDVEDDVLSTRFLASRKEMFSVCLILRTNCSFT